MEFKIAAQPARARRVLAALLTLIALSVLVALSGACGGGDDDGGDANDGGQVGRTITVAGGSYTQVTPTELERMLQSKDFPLINVHIPYEGEIEGTDQHIPFDQITQRLGDLPSDKNAKVVIYCRSGNMSTRAAGDLVQAGYTNIWELGGGMIAWTDAGLPLITEG
jgi:rhodanese-related sulfurtransferase